jgi:glycosyltransferase involved in cell wall biosynthesis
MQRKLRVAIDATLVPGRSGGVETVLLGLVKALGTLSDGPEQYTVLVSPEAPGWLDSVLGANQRVVTVPPPTSTPPRLSRAFARELVSRTFDKVTSRPPPRPWPQVPISDGFIEGLGCDVVHFPTQAFTLCALPSIYNPHDLQHLHYPQFFSPEELAWRDVIYRGGCRLSHSVVVASQWVANDIARQLGVTPGKLQVIPWAPPTQAIAAPSAEARRGLLIKYGVEAPYFLYPAVTWEHKNHVRLLEAVATVRDRCGISLRLVCTGRKHPSTWPRIEAALNQYGLHEQVTFLGTVPAVDLRALYAEAQFVFVPTLFEAASAPIFEAWLEGVPAACSTVTSLPEQVSDAALLFDPLSVDSMADALQRMATDSDLRAKLRERGTKRLRSFDWDATAKAYRAVYRRAAGRLPLSEEDERLLAWDWMRGELQGRLRAT